MLPQTAEMNSKNEGNACKFSTSMTISCEGGVTMSPRVIKPKLVWPWTPASPVFFCSFQQTQLYTTQTSEVLELSICNSIFGAICRLKAVLLVCGCGSDTNIFKSGAIVFCLLCFSKILLYSIFFKIICSTMSGSDQPQLPPYVIPGNPTCLFLFLYLEDNAKQGESVLLFQGNLVESVFPTIPIIS